MVRRQLAEETSETVPVPVVVIVELRHRDEQPRRGGPQRLREGGWPPGVEIELHAELPEPGEFASGNGIGHSMNKADRGIAEMDEPGFDE